MSRKKICEKLMSVNLELLNTYDVLKILKNEQSILLKNRRCIENDVLYGKISEKITCANAQLARLLLEVTDTENEIRALCNEECKDDIAMLIFKMVIIDKMNLKQVARKMNYTYDHIRRIHSKTLIILNATKNAKNGKIVASFHKTNEKN